jgi:hypothetical protein
MFAIGTSVFGAYVVSGLVEASGRLRWQRIEAVETGDRGRLRTLGAVAPERVERWRRLDAPAVLRPLRAAQAGDAVVVALVLDGQQGQFETAGRPRGQAGGAEQGAGEHRAPGCRV